MKKKQMETAFMIHDLLTILISRIGRRWNMVHSSFAIIHNNHRSA